MKALVEFMTDLWNFTLIISAVFGLSSQMQLKASLSTLHLREQRFSVSSPGSISVLLSTRYTVVDLKAASLSIAASGFTKWVTSAIWTPHSIFPFGRVLEWRASSISLQPGGSTEH